LKGGLETEGSEMKKTNEIQRILEFHKEELKKDFGVKEIGLFGSYVREEQTQTSDIDVLVEFEKPIGLLEFVGLKNHLSDLLGVKVDLVMKKALKPRIGDRILNEVVYV
jgi:predicted nucleotidyltransferase